MVIKLATLSLSPLAQGERRRRLEGDAYYAAVDELCAAFKEVWPHALLQFEDFETSRAFAILERWRPRMLCFNDDIQVRVERRLQNAALSFSSKQLP